MSAFAVFSLFLWWNSRDCHRTLCFRRLRRFDVSLYFLLFDFPSSVFIYWANREHRNDLFVVFFVSFSVRLDFLKCGSHRWNRQKYDFVVVCYFYQAGCTVHFGLFECCHPTFVDRLAIVVSFAPVFYNQSWFYRGDIERVRARSHTLSYSFRFICSTFIQMYRYHNNKIALHFTIPSFSVWYLHLCLHKIQKHTRSLIPMHKYCQMNRFTDGTIIFAHLLNICVYFCRRQTVHHDE